MSGMADPLAVAVITAWYPSQERPMNGVFVREHARAAALHHEVAVIADAGTRQGGRLFSLNEPAESPRVLRLEHRASRLPGATGAAHLAGVLAALRRLRREGFRPDIVHAHVHDVALAALSVGRRLRIPVVISEHSSRFARGAVSPMAARLVRFVFPRADLVCPPSEYLRREISAYGVHGRFEVVPNPVDTEIFAPSEPPSGPTRALFVGGLNELKQVDLLLRACAGVEGLVLELVGDGPERARLEGIATDCGIADRVEFRGYLPPAEVSERLRSASFLVAPSATETFGVAIAEALCAGRPVVGTAVGAIPELIDDSNGLLVEPGRPDELRSALTRMVEERARFDWRAISQAAAGRYSLAEVGRRWDAIYRSVSNRTPSAVAS